MDKLEQIESYIMDEIDGAWEYLACSEKIQKYKSTFIEMAKDELSHAEAMQSILNDILKGSMDEKKNAVIEFLITVNNHNIEKVKAKL